MKDKPTFFNSNNNNDNNNNNNNNNNDNNDNNNGSFPSPPSPPLDVNSFNPLSSPSRQLLSPIISRVQSPPLNFSLLTNAVIRKDQPQEIGSIGEWEPVKEKKQELFFKNWRQSERAPESPKIVFGNQLINILTSKADNILQTGSANDTNLDKKELEDIKDECNFDDIEDTFNEDRGARAVRVFL